MEVVKVRMQSQKTESVLVAKNPNQCPKCTYFVLDNGLMEHVCEKNSSALFTKRAVEPVTCKEVRFRNSFHAFRFILKCEGVGAFYNGLAPTLWMAVPATVCYFSTYDELKNRMLKYGLNTSSSAVLAGSLSRSFAVTCVAPFELIRTKVIIIIVINVYLTYKNHCRRKQ